MYLLYILPGACRKAISNTCFVEREPCVLRLTAYTDYALRRLMFVPGFVETVRGRNGGLRLAKPATSIRLGDVVRHTEQDMTLVPCFEPDNADCAIQSCCGLRRALGRATDTFLAELDKVTLADLAKPRSALRNLLAIEVAAPAGRGGAGPRPRV